MSDRSAGRRVIFLDIDGVVAPTRERDRYGELDPTCIQVLNEIVAGSGAEVVVSSSLRFGKTVAELQQLLEAAGFVGRVVDKTPTDMRGCTRGEEIAAWLASHPVERCVILDDHRDMGELLEHLVQTETAVGLRPSDAARALEKLLDVGSGRNAPHQEGNGRRPTPVPVATAMGRLLR